MLYLVTLLLHTFNNESLVLKCRGVPFSMQPWLARYNSKLQVNILSRPLPEVIFYIALFSLPDRKLPAKTNNNLWICIIRVLCYQPEISWEQFDGSLESSSEARMKQYNDRTSYQFISQSIGYHLHFWFLILQVNLNGVLSFNQACNVITPQPFPYKGYALISLFWENFETARFGHVYYRTTTDSLLLTRTQRYVEDTFPSIGGFNPSYLLIATWDRVPQNTVYSGGRTDLVSKYQLLETL